MAPQRPRHHSRYHCPLRSSQARSNFAAFMAFVLSVPAKALEGPKSYHPDCEAQVNVQIQLQLYASYVYKSMAVYCNCFTVALSHFSPFFLRRSQHWRGGAEKLIWMQNKRGGRVLFQDILEPNTNDWHGSVQVVECAIHLENNLRKSFLLLHRLAAEKADPELCDFILTHYLNPQLAVLKNLEECLITLREMRTLRESVENYFHRLNLDDDDSGGSNKEN
ncbi:Ferritin heavy chain [Heterocephalus glaber]|uniref:Ferritin n=1 Tax=Heterocephalus glaber TaxID=10181 RepID=G5B865_HETGA|nr:Ferritin heavy chain [Heterocephalus glaber]